MRLFIAINPSNEQIEEIKRVQSLFKTNDVNASFTSNFHLTLKFLGEIDEDKFEKLTFELAKVRFNKFNLKLSEIGAFPSKHHINVLWVGVEKNHNLDDLYNNIEESLKKFKIKEDHGFHPHITLARIKTLHDKKGFIKKMEETNINKLETKITSFTLYKSTLTPSGPIYEVVRDFLIN